MEPFPAAFGAKPRFHLERESSLSQVSCIQISKKKKIMRRRLKPTSPHTFIMAPLINGSALRTKSLNTLLTPF